MGDMAELAREREELAESHTTENDLSFMFHSKIVGTTFREPKQLIQDTIKSLTKGITLTLMREPENPYDINAVAVYFNDLQLGYLPKATAEGVATLMDNGTHVYALVSEITGAGKSNAGCNLEIHRID